MLAATLPPQVTGLVATYFGDIGTTARYYWVRANYEGGSSLIAGPALVTTAATLNKNNQVLLTWSSSPGALSYDVLQTTTSTLPTVSAAILNKENVTTNSYTDTGDTLATYVPFAAPGISGYGIRVAHAIYSFAVDGGVSGAITPVKTASIPANAIIIGGTINSTTAVTSGGAATVAVGTTAGSAANSILTATAKATLSSNALVNSTATLAAPVKMSAIGNINITVATADLTAGVIEIFVFYIGPTTA